MINAATERQEMTHGITWAPFEAGVAWGPGSYRTGRRGFSLNREPMDDVPEQNEPG